MGRSPDANGDPNSGDGEKYVLSTPLPIVATFPRAFGRGVAEERRFLPGDENARLRNARAISRS